MENLNVAAEMHLMKKDNPAVHGLIAVGDVTVNDLFIIHNVKVLNVENDGKSDLAAVLPKKKMLKQGSGKMFSIYLPNCQAGLKKLRLMIP